MQPENRGTPKRSKLVRRAAAAIYCAHGAHRARVSLWLCRCGSCTRHVHNSLHTLQGHRSNTSSRSRRDMLTNGVNAPALCSGTRSANRGARLEKQLTGDLAFGQQPIEGVRTHTPSALYWLRRHFIVYKESHFHTEQMRSYLRLSEELSLIFCHCESSVHTC